MKNAQKCKELGEIEFIIFYLFFPRNFHHEWRRGYEKQINNLAGRLYVYQTKTIMQTITIWVFLCLKVFMMLI